MATTVPPLRSGIEDETRMKQVLATHLGNGEKIDVIPLVHLVDDILSRANMQVQDVISEEKWEAAIQGADYTDTLAALSYKLDRIYCEIERKSMKRVDGDETAISVLNMLSSYSWEAKLGLTLAAFALNYGEFWLQAQSYSSNDLAKSMAVFKQWPVNMEQSSPLKPRLDALQSLVKSIWALTRWIVALGVLEEYMASESEFKEVIAAKPIMVFRGIRAIVACTNHIISITGMGLEDTTSDKAATELSTLDDEIKKTSKLIQKLDEKKKTEAYEQLKRTLEMTETDNMRVLKALIYAKDDDVQPLFDASSKKQVNVNVLRRKTVLLLISSLDISTNELSILKEKLQKETDQSKVVWFPIVEQWKEEMQKQFKSVQSSMPWYTVVHPTLIEDTVRRFVKEKWQFKGKTMVVVLDPQGRVVNPNAIHMIWVFGSVGSPFTSSKEENLWKQNIWGLQLLVDRSFKWDGKRIIILYGGEDIGWIRKLTTTARYAAQVVGIPVEMVLLVYVGKSSINERVRGNIATITKDKLSETLEELRIWFFWTRLESMVISKRISLGSAADVDRNNIIQECTKLLSYGSNGGGWAILSKGSTILSTLVENNACKVGDVATPLESEGFERSFKDHYDYYERLQEMLDKPCVRLQIPDTAKSIPESLKCPRCTRELEKFIAFDCCHGKQEHH